MMVEMGQRWVGYCGMIKDFYKFTDDDGLAHMGWRRR